MLLIDRQEVERLLDPSSCREAMRETMIALSKGAADQPLREVLRLHGGSHSALFMPASLEAPPVLGVKVVTIYPDNHQRGVPSHHGAMLLFESETGRPIALLEGSSLTGIRTAAVSAFATRLLSRPEARRHAILGTGVQARCHLAAYLESSDVDSIRIWSPRAPSRESFLETVDLPDGVRIEAVETAEEAVRNADVVTTVTSSPEPLLQADWLSPGTHINAVGASTATTREIDTRTVTGATRFIDHRASALAEAGDLLIPIDEGRLQPDEIGTEIGAVAAGQRPGRSSEKEITLFKSVGLAVQDLAAAHLVVELARREGAGQDIDWN
jgi:ornithine cyclodeaminase